MIVDTVETLKERTCQPYMKICDSLRIKYPTFKRWRKRVKLKLPLVRLPGPKKVEPIHAGKIADDIQNLKHCQKRSHGTGRLYSIHKSSISRRELQHLVAMARFDAYVEHRKNLRRIQWLVPGVIWSMDDTEFGYDESGRKLYLHNMLDLSSTYKFNPIAGEFACGEGISAHLERHSSKYGPPLFLKRDNHGNLNHKLVNETLDKYFVIPLNSPTYYPQYNGGIEQFQYEFKKVIRDKMCPYDNCHRDHFGAYADAAVNEINHLPRRTLRGQNACNVFFEKKNNVKFNIRERRLIYDWILEKTNGIFVRMGDSSKTAFQSAYRIAVETWLRMKGFIIVSIGGKVLPYFLGEMGHN